MEDTMNKRLMFTILLFLGLIFVCGQNECGKQMFQYNNIIKHEGVNTSFRVNNFKEFYYYSGGRKVKLAINDDVLVVKHKDAEHSQSNLEFLQKFKELSYEIDTFPKSRNGYFYLRKKDKGISLTMKDIRDLYKIDSGIEWISPGYKSEQGSGFFIGDELIVKFYPHVTIEDINKMNEKYGVETVSKDEWLDQYILRNVHPEISDTLAIANYYYETPELVNYAVPNMMAEFEDGLMKIMASSNVQITDCKSNNQKITIAIIEQGHIYNHECFYKNKDKNQENMLINGLSKEQQTKKDLISKHKTNVAGIVARYSRFLSDFEFPEGKDDWCGKTGAYLCDINISEYRDNNDAWTVGAINAIEDAATQANIINMSLTDKYNKEIYWTDPFLAALKTAYNNGVLVVGSAGNYYLNDKDGDSVYNNAEYTGYNGKCNEEMVKNCIEKTTKESCEAVKDGWPIGDRYCYWWCRTNSCAPRCLDNCPLTTNFEIEDSQKDEDGDKAGDACDPDKTTCFGPNDENCKTHFEDKVGKPAAFPFVIAVGSYDPSTLNRCTVNSCDNFESQYGFWLDLMAPGDEVETTCVSNDCDSECSSDWETDFGATSAAAPAISGTLGAILKSFIDKNILLSPEQARFVLVLTATKKSLSISEKEICKINWTYNSLDDSFISWNNCYGFGFLDNIAYFLATHYLDNNLLTYFNDEELKPEGGKDQPYALAIRVLKEKHIVEGYPDPINPGKYIFKPDEPITRAETLAMVMRAAGLFSKNNQDLSSAACIIPNRGGYFHDAPEFDSKTGKSVCHRDEDGSPCPTWYCNYIYEGVNQGIIVPHDHQNHLNFRPADPITRAEAVKIAIMAFQLYNSNAPSSCFVDIKDSSAWYYSFINSAYNGKFIECGDSGVYSHSGNIFSPGNYMPRKLLADIIYKMIFVKSNSKEYSDYEENIGYLSPDSGGTFVPFTESSPTVDLSAPNGNEILTVGNTYTIRFSARDDESISEVQLYYRLSDSSNWLTIATGLSNRTSYSWKVPSTPTTTAKIQVKVIDNHNNSAINTSDNFFTIQAEDLCLKPSSFDWRGTSFIASEGSIYLKWYGDYYADYYILQEDDNSSFTSPESYTQTDVIKRFENKPTGHYYYRVKGLNECGESPWTTTEHIEVIRDYDPETITYSPADNATGISSSVTLQWNAPHDGGETITYEVYFAPRNESVITSGMLIYTGTGTSYALTRLPYGETCTWKVYAYDEDRDEISTPILHFTTSADSSAPTGNILINGRAATTETYGVQLTLNATDTGSGVDYMRISNDGVHWKEWIGYETPYLWNLADSNYGGTTGRTVYTVYVQFRDKEGNNSPIYTDTIERVVTGTPGNIILNNRLYETVQDALDAAQSGDTVYLTEGTFHLYGGNYWPDYPSRLTCFYIKPGVSLVGAGYGKTKLVSEAFSYWPGVMKPTSALRGLRFNGNGKSYIHAPSGGVTISDCYLEYCNTAINSTNDGLPIAPVEIYNNIIAFSYADGIFLSTATSGHKIYNNVITNVDSIGIHTNYPAEIVNNIVINSAIGIMGGNPSSIRHNNIFGNSRNYENNDPGDQTGQNGNISIDPQFENPSGSDFRLKSISPCINTGSNMGLPYNGAAPDMGAIEYNATGTIKVVSNRADAAFSIKGPQNFNGSGTSSTRSNVPAGLYQITFSPITNYYSPYFITKWLGAGQTITFDGTYRNDTTGPSGTLIIDFTRYATSDTQVILTLDVEDEITGMGPASQMQFSNNGTIWSTPQSYSSLKKNWDLTAYGGNNTSEIG